MRLIICAAVAHTRERKGSEAAEECPWSVALRGATPVWGGQCLAFARLPRKQTRTRTRSRTGLFTNALRRCPASQTNSEQTFTNMANCSRTRPRGMHVIQFKNRKVIVGKCYRKLARHAPFDLAGARRCVFDIIAVSTTITGRYSSRHASCVVDLSSLSNLHRA